ncbi:MULTISPECIES: DNA polymerase III subunit chi [Sphingomonas]|jgi:DNA polymerase-3 subunit chi|uniref:DNA polymerase III subunit chi n=1 Tax=Sphingomonas hankookensis TaxID=563996 RepID=A0ABR5YGR4_9SPHN|nr:MULTISPECIES: DNA polymerase III subunit chi [Sphingomonas]KZE18909.1 DNA polymerase III subunit chi [Sphingomonas hankookensis]PZT93309.1 MAG: DNA polymerase III subunit chi [Sphingomonas sp.]RSV32478.1 DNA polymerase III subunit chi [Sphingomonas sp. ABOLH]WCP70829.1 DNA polymerase III subunit chi [Sphingomonas hankookensis]
MKVDFYHLTRSPLDRVLPRIAQRLHDDGERLLLLSDDADQRRHLDMLLWTYAPDSFLPHAEAGSGDDACQAVLIAPEPTDANAARNVAIVDGRWRDEALTFDRAFHFFGEDHIAAARTAWKGLADREDVERRYWRQGDGGWEQAA